MFDSYPPAKRYYIGSNLSIGAAYSTAVGSSYATSHNFPYAQAAHA
jgi:hypothetical protein